MTVVTPNRRLAAALKRTFDHNQQQIGHRAWAAPDILPVTTFLTRTYQAVRLRDETAIGASPHLIDAPQSQILWEQLIRQSDTNALLSVPQTAKQAAAAWSVANQWRLLDAMRVFPLHEDGRVFFDWALRYQQLCREMNVIDHAVLPDVLADLLKSALANTKNGQQPISRLLPGQLLTVGFDIVTPQIDAFFKTCASGGILVGPLFDDNLGDGATTAGTKRMVFASEDDELRACAAWARAQLEAGGQSHNSARIAIVVPDLQNKRGRISRALTDALVPLARAEMDPGVGGQLPSTLFNLSLGLPLNEYGLVNDALELIEFAQQRPVPFARFSGLLRSPFVGGAEREMAARAGLDALLRDVLPAETSLFVLQKILKLTAGKRLRLRLASAARSCPLWLEIVDRVAALPIDAATAAAKRPTGPQKRSPHDWSRHFTKVLAAWGFPGERALGSSDFQVLAKFRDALGMLAALENVQSRMRADEALTQLRRIVGDTVFQPESAGTNEAPIQVLGILESAGQSFDPFDAMWVTGLSDDAWPLAARPNPFIPAALQRRAGVTEASAATSLALDQRITDGWLHSANQLIVSHAMNDGANSSGEQTRPASALICGFPLHAATSRVANYTESLQAANVAHPREVIPDAAFMALPANTVVSGGSGIIRDQAACPFRAFARHRLAAKSLAEPAAGLDAAARGTLLHLVLSLVWKQLTSQAALLAMENAATAALVSDAVHQAINEVRADGVEMLVGRFAEIEHTRLCQVVTSWLAVERERLPFAVTACEQSQVVDIAGLTMRLQLDRLDRLHDGTYALIDYKTGVAQVKGWLGERPDEPQLPLYFHTAEQAVSVLAFARLKRGKTFGFEGVSATDNVLPNVTPIEQKRGMPEQGYVSWDVLVQEWEMALDSLATQFVQGIAAVDPKNGGLTCNQCDLQSVCRVAELAGLPGEVDSDDINVDGTSAIAGAGDE